MIGKSILNWRNCKDFSRVRLWGVNVELGEIILKGQVRIREVEYQDKICVLENYFWFRYG